MIICNISFIGSGKTRIAAEIGIRRILKIKSCKILLLAPTIILVKQQAKVFAEAFGRKVITFVGGSKTPPGNFTILVSTPGAYASLLSLEDFQVSKFGLIVFDEVHHLAKNHPYSVIANIIQGLDPKVSNIPQVIGLTASMTYSCKEDEIKQNIIALMNSINFTKLLTASYEELSDSGYKAFTTLTHIAIDPNSVEMNVYRQLEHYTLVMIEKIEEFLINEDSSYKPPRLINSKSSEWLQDITNFREISSKTSNAMEYRLVLDYLEYFYEAYRLQLIPNLKASCELSMYYLEMSGCFDGLDDANTVNQPSQKRQKLEENNTINDDIPNTEITSTSVLNARVLPIHIRKVFIYLYRYWLRIKCNYSKLDKLKDILISQHSHHCQNELAIKSHQNKLKRKCDRSSPFKCIIFVQSRINCHILHYFLSLDRDLDYLGGINYIYSASNYPTGKLTMSKPELESRLQQFANGDMNILISTSVSEEGIDIADANCVIRFDPVLTPVSLVQSRGRARKVDSTFIVMDELESRSVGVLMNSEKLHREFLVSAKEFLAPHLNVETEQSNVMDIVDMNDDEEWVYKQLEIENEMLFNAMLSPEDTKKNQIAVKIMKILNREGLDSISKVGYVLTEDGGTRTDSYEETDSMNWKCTILINSKHFGNLSGTSQSSFSRKKDATRDACEIVLAAVKSRILLDKEEMHSRMVGIFNYDELTTDSMIETNLFNAENIVHNERKETVDTTAEKCSIEVMESDESATSVIIESVANVNEFNKQSESTIDNSAHENLIITINNNNENINNSVNDNNELSNVITPSDEMNNNASGLFYNADSNENSKLNSENFIRCHSEASNSNYIDTDSQNSVRINDRIQNIESIDATVKVNNKVYSVTNETIVLQDMDNHADKPIHEASVVDSSVIDSSVIDSSVIDSSRTNNILLKCMKLLYQDKVDPICKLTYILAQDNGTKAESYEELEGIRWKCTLSIDSKNFGNISRTSTTSFSRKKDSLRDVCSVLLPVIEDIVKEKLYGKVKTTAENFADDESKSNIRQEVEGTAAISDISNEKSDNTNLTSSLGHPSMDTLIVNTNQFFPTSTNSAPNVAEVNVVTANIQTSSDVTSNMGKMIGYHKFLSKCLKILNQDNANEISKLSYILNEDGGSKAELYKEIEGTKWQCTVTIESKYFGSISNTSQSSYSRKKDALKDVSTLLLNTIRHLLFDNKISMT